MWNVTDWQKVVFSDESRFDLGTDDNRVRVWTLVSGTIPHTVLRHTARTAGVMVWGAIFQQDNARPHTARVAQDFLRHFQTLPWLARFLDLPPVEHVWNQLKRQMPSCYSADDLELAAQDLWVHLPQDNISENYDEELTKNIHSTIVENRKAREKKQEEQKEKLRIEEREENLRIEEQKEKLRIEEREEKLCIEQSRLDEQKRKVE
ncbi:transposable element Tcb2 transposase [Trichonephila clavipes]|nr:transposable element Tcb2 transposase [Trichonephila clavipes]